MDIPNKYIRAHGGTSARKFMVVPEGVKVALTAALGTISQGTEGSRTDLARKEFLTWYYPGDIMPQIAFAAMNRSEDQRYPPPTKFLEIDDCEPLSYLIDEMTNYKGTIYLTCCLQRSPPEFSKIRPDNNYTTLFHYYAPKIPGIRLSKGDILVQERLAGASDTGPPGEYFIVHPSLCPGLFKRLFYDRQRVDNPAVSVLWLTGTRYRIVQGSADDYEEYMSKKNVPMRVSDSTSPYFDDQLTNEKIEWEVHRKTGCGLIHVKGLGSDWGADLGIYLVNTFPRIMDYKLANPVWGAWEVTPVRGGGYALDRDRPELGIADHITNGKPFSGDLELIRSGEEGKLHSMTTRTKDHVFDGEVHFA